MAYNSKYTGAEVDALLDKVAANDVISIDSALSTTSENPVQNKVIVNEFKRVDALEEIHKTLDVTVEKLVKEKVDAMDYAPNLSVGLADNLAGEDVVDSEVSFRRSGGGAISDGTARIEAIKGNSVVWNKLVKNNLTEATINGVTFTPQADGGILVNGTASANSFYAFTDKNVYIANHKVALIGSKNDVGIAFGGNIVSSNVNKDYIFTKTESFDNQCFLFILSGSVIENVIIYPIVSDLTLMFGVGNEPITIDEFNARKPLGIDEYAYNEGEVIHMDAQSLESVGVNQWDEEWELGSLSIEDGSPSYSSTRIRSKNFIPIIGGQTYYGTIGGGAANYAWLYDANKKLISATLNISNRSFELPTNAKYMKFVTYDYGITYNHDICINLSDASVNGKYFPYIKRTQSLAIIGEGLKSAGTAHDEIRYNKATQKWEKVQRIGSVNLGSLSWAISNEFSFFRAYIANKRSNIASGEKSRLLCEVYVSGDTTYVSSSNKEDKTIYESYSTGEGTAIYIKDTSYTDVASFKAAMNGVILYYELAEPIVTELDDDFNLDYEVWNDGTEKILSDVPTTALNP